MPGGVLIRDDARLARSGAEVCAIWTEAVGSLQDHAFVERTAQYIVISMPPPEHFMNQSQSANLPRLTTGAAKHQGNRSENIMGPTLE